MTGVSRAWGIYSDDGVAPIGDRTISGAPRQVSRAIIQRCTATPRRWAIDQGHEETVIVVCEICGLETVHTPRYQIKILHGGSFE